MSQDEIQRDLLLPETKELYDKDAQNYFRNIGTTKNPGPSADELAKVEPHLPSSKDQCAYADRLDRGFDKTRRSGARVNSPTGVPAIFPGGLKEASQFIDEFTPGKYKPQEEMKPPETQQAPTGWFPKPAVVLDICPDCMEAVSNKQYVLGMTIVQEDDSQKLLSMKVKFGDIVVYNVCVPCFEAAKTIARDSTPLALVFGGQLTDPKDIALAMRYNFPINLHDGQEKTMGQFRMIERADRVMTNIWDYLIAQPESSPIFRANKVSNDERN